MSAIVIEKLMVRGIDVRVDCACVSGSTLKNPSTGECWHCGGLSTVRRTLTLAEFAGLFGLTAPEVSP